MFELVKKYVPYGTWFVPNIDFLAFLGVISLIPFSIRNVFETSLNFQTGAYSDFTSISLYLSDFLIIWLISRHFQVFKASLWWRLVGMAIIWLGLELIFNRFLPLETYFIARLIALLLLAGAIKYLALDKAKIIITTWFFVILGAIQSLLALVQFMSQKSVGLYFFGESHLGPGLYGVAKIVAHGTKLIRGYGTFPHSNLLAAFLLTSTLLCLYLLTLNYQKLTKVLIAILFSVNFTGILLSFSRGGIAAAILGISLVVVAAFLAKRWKLGVIILALSLVVAGIGSLALKPYLLTRSTISDEAVKERLFYNKIGFEIIKDKPILGTGPGLSVLHMEQYSPTKLETWEIQPIHNFYLITFAEWGIGGFIFLALILLPIYLILKKAWVSLKQAGSSFLWEATLSAIGLSFLFLFFFDHYFYTIWPTQLLLWIFIGFIVAQTKEPVT